MLRGVEDLILQALPFDFPLHLWVENCVEYLFFPKASCLFFPKGR